MVRFSTMDGFPWLSPQDVLKAIVGYEVVGTMSAWDRGLPMMPHPDRKSWAPMNGRKLDGDMRCSRVAIMIGHLS